MGYIYMIENNINHKKYICQTIRHWSRRIGKTLKVSFFVGANPNGSNTVICVTRAEHRG